MKSSIIVLMLSIMTSVAHAGFYIEPYLGYDASNSKGDVTITSPSASVIAVDVEESGVRFGSRVGFATSSWIFGIDFLTGELADKDDDKATHTDMGVFATYRFDKKYNATLGYVASSLIKSDDFEITGSSGFRLGFGVAVHPRMNLNLDYLMVSYDKLDFDPLEGTVDVDKGTVLLSLSFPFEF